MQEDITFFSISATLTLYNLKATPPYLSIDTDFVSGIPNGDTFLKNKYLKQAKLQALDTIEESLVSENQEDILEYMRKATYSKLSLRSVNFIGTGSTEEFLDESSKESEEPKKEE